jgi:tetratricopeptide (TPR) repeat protein
MQSGGGAAGAGNPESASPGLADPKDRIDVSEAINDVGLLLKQDRTGEAVAAAERLRKEWPSETSVLNIYGEALLASGRFPELLRYLDGVLGTDLRRPAWALALKAKSLEAAGRTDEAIAAHREAAAAGGDGGANRLQAAVLLRRADRLAESTAEARGAGTAGPLAAEALRLIADNERDQGRPDQALVALQAAERAAPDDPTLLADLGRELMQAGRIPEARRISERLSAVAANLPDGPMLSGACDVAEGRPRDSLPKFERALAADPANADALYWMATAFLDAGDAARAEAPARRLVETKPESWLSHRTLGRVLLAQGRRAEAAVALRRALQLKPGDPVSAELLRNASAAPAR